MASFGNLSDYCNYLTGVNNTTFTIGNTTKAGNVWSASLDRTIGAVSFYVAQITGSVSQFQWKAELFKDFWLATNVTSSAISTSYYESIPSEWTGSNGGWIKFYFKAPINIESGSVYGLLMSRTDNAVSTSDHPTLRYAFHDAEDFDDWIQLPDSEIFGKFFRTGGTGGTVYSSSWTMEIFDWTAESNVPVSSNIILDLSVTAGSAANPVDVVGTSIITSQISNKLINKVSSIGVSSTTTQILNKTIKKTSVIGTSTVVSKILNKIIKSTFVIGTSSTTSKILLDLTVTVASGENPVYVIGASSITTLLSDKLIRNKSPSSVSQITTLISEKLIKKTAIVGIDSINTNLRLLLSSRMRVSSSSSITTKLLLNTLNTGLRILIIDDILDFNLDDELISANINYDELSIIRISK